MSEVEALAIHLYSRHDFSLTHKCSWRNSSKDPKLILAVPTSFSHGQSRSSFADFAAVPDNVILLTGRGGEGTLGRMLFEHWNLNIGVYLSVPPRITGIRANSAAVDGSLDICVDLRFYPALVMRVLIFSKAKLKSTSGGCRARDPPTKATSHTRESCRSAGGRLCITNNFRGR